MPSRPKVREDRVEALLSEASRMDKFWFVLGVGNCAFTPFLLGRAPSWYYAYFTPKVGGVVYERYNF